MIFDQTMYDETCRGGAIAKSEANVGARKWAIEPYCVGEIGSCKRIYSCIC
jgi:hypothetical protein